MADNKNIIIAIILIALALFFFKDILFSIFSVGIPLVTSTATCTGTLSTGPITQADCDQLPAKAFGSLDGWGFSTAGEGTLTLPEPARQVTLAGLFRKEVNAISAQLWIYNYNLNVYEGAGFIFYDENNIESQSQSRVYGQDYIGGDNHTVVKIKWNMQCPQSQCFSGVDKPAVAGQNTLMIIQYDSIVDTTSTTSTSTTIPGNATSSNGTITTTTPSTSSTTTTMLGTAGVSAGQQALFSGISNNALLMIAIIGIAAIVFLRQKGKR